MCAGSVNRTDRLGRVTRLQYYCVLLTNLFVISDTGMTSVPRSARNASRSYSVGLLATILVEYNVNHFDLCASNESATVRIASFLVYFSFFYLMYNAIQGNGLLRLQLSFVKVPLLHNKRNINITVTRKRRYRGVNESKHSFGLIIK